VIRVLIADDQTLLRRGLRGLLDLTDDLRVVAEASDGDEALAILAHHEVDVLLLDVRMPCRTGVQVLEELQRTGRMRPTVLLTTFDDDAALIAGIRAGARGWLLKDVDFDRLADH
jgi:DNA-binding NarL/FixJ family response regulator